MTEKLCFDIWQEQDISVFSHASREAPGLTQYPIQSVQLALFIGAKRAGRKSLTVNLNQLIKIRNKEE
jgi:hypothetical protein